jgi:hypothetical protein
MSRWKFRDRYPLSPSRSEPASPHLPWRQAREDVPGHPGLLALGGGFVLREYYGRLFLEHPHLEWAGMASTIGPAFYAGFRDLGVLPDALRRAVIALLGRASRRLATRVAGDLGFYETTFLRMQKKIFEDQAPMHEAYLAGGVAEIEKLYRARIIDIATLEAWREIEAGWREADAASIERGNRMLLFREQRDIIDRFYVRMLQFWPRDRATRGRLGCPRCGPARSRSSSFTIPSTRTRSSRTRPECGLTSPMGGGMLG